MASQPTESSSNIASSSHFVPRPFPPPSLRDVPEAYIISQLHHLAPNFWSKPETADCTIIVPYGPEQPLPGHVARPPSPDPLTTGPFKTESSTSRRDSGSRSVGSQRMTLKLHQDFLCAQSTSIRAILSGSYPLDLSARAPPPCDSGSGTPSSASPPQQPSSHLATGTLAIPPSRRPRVLPSSSPHHPLLFLPVPDSNSFPHLVHYIYFGTFKYMEECLHRGIISWQGVVRNVEYLGMPVELKAALGRYYREWLRPNDPTQDPHVPVDEDSEEEGDVESDTSSVSDNSSESQPNG